MPGSVERWLQTFMCTQYAHIFEAYGYRSLQAVCHLQMPHLLAMGVPRGHCEKILENINVLRQTMFGRIQKPPESVTDFHHIKYNPPLNPAAYALKSVAMNANYRGMNQFPEEYSGYGQNASNMQAVGYHQGNYDGANMAMMNHMSGGSSSYGMPGYDASQGQMMMSGQAPLPDHYQSTQQQQAAYLAHQQQYYAGGNSTSGTAGQYSQQYAMQGSSSGGSAGVQGMSGSSASYYSSGGAGSGGQGSPSSKMAPPQHHHLRNTSGQQNPQRVADNILQMASAYPSHHTVQVPLKNRHAPYQIPRSPHYGYTADKGMAAQQGMSGQPSVSCQQTISNQPQQQQPGMGGMGQAPVLMYLPSSPHSQPQPRTSPMSPLMMHSPASHQQSLPSPGSMHSPNSASVHSPAQSPNLRSPCSMPMSTSSMSICSPGHMPSGFSTQQMSSPPQRTYSTSDVPNSSQQHCTPTSMHSPVSHMGSPYGMSGQMSSPPHQVYSASSSTSPYKMEMLMDSGQGPGGQGLCVGGQAQHKHQGTNPLQSLQKLVMLPETQVVDPKSVVSDACLPGSDQGSSGECSKNGEDPAGQSEEAVGCSAGCSATSSPPVACQSSTSSDTGSVLSNGVATLCDRTGTIVDGPTSPSVQPENSNLTPCQNMTLSSGIQSNIKRTGSTNAFQSNSTKVSTQPQISQSPVSHTASKPISSKLHHISTTSTSIQSVYTQSNSQTSHTHVHSGTTVLPSAATKTPHYSRQSKKTVIASPLKCNGNITAPVDTVSVEATCSTSSTSDTLTKAQTSHILEDMKKSPKHSVSTQPSKVNSATQQVPHTRHSERLTHSHPKLISSVATQSQSTTCNSESVSTAKLMASKPKVVNGFDTKHINGSASTEELAGHSFPQQKNSHPDNVCKKPEASSVADSTVLSKKVTLPKLHGKHTRVSVPVESGCALVAVNGPMQADISSSGRQEHFDHSDQGDTDEEVEKAFDGHSGALSKLCSIFPPHVKSLGDDDDLTFPASGSDNEDFSFSDGFDLGYDSPPIEMKEASNRKPDVVLTVSTPDEDEADGVAVCPEQDSDKGISPKNKGSAGTSNPAKVNPTTPTRTVTRSSTGSIPKRKAEPETVDFPKRIRRSSGAGDRQSNHAPLIQCGKSHEKEDVKVINTDNATDKSGKEEKSGKDADSKPVKERMETEKSRNNQKSPVVVLTKSPVRGVKKKKQKKGAGNKPLNKVTRFLPRGKNGRFLITGERIRQQDERKSQVKWEYTEDDKPHIVVQRRNSRGESNGATISDSSVKVAVKTESSAVTQTVNTQKEKSEAQVKRVPIKTETTVTDRNVESRSFRTDSKPTSELTVNGFCNSSSSKLKPSSPSAKSLPVDDTFTMSRVAASVVTADIVNMLSVSLDKSAPGTPASASSSTAGTPKKRGRPKKGDETTPQKKKIKSSKNKKKKKDFQRQHSEDDSFTTMKLSKTLNLMQNKKKKGEGSQSVSGLFSPFVRVQGTKQQPSLVSVFNHPSSEKIDPKSTGKKKTVTGSAPVMTSIPITNFSSDKTVMLPATKTDTSPWVCALCGMRSSYRFMGDLFGPYYLESHLAILNKADASKDSKKGAGSSAAADVKMTRRRSVGSRTSSAGGENPETPQEVWVHEDCAMWSNGVYLVGSRIYGLEEALKAATATICACCREKGAMLGCLHKGCNQNFHYMCAVDKDCYLDVENFSMLCPKHKDKRLKSLAASTPSTSRL